MLSIRCFIDFAEQRIMWPRPKYGIAEVRIIFCQYVCIGLPYAVEPGFFGGLLREPPVMLNLYHTGIYSDRKSCPLPDPAPPCLNPHPVPVRNGRIHAGCRIGVYIHKGVWAPFSKKTPRLHGRLSQRLLMQQGRGRLQGRQGS